MEHALRKPETDFALNPEIKTESRCVTLSAHSPFASKRREPTYDHVMS